MKTNFIKLNGLLILITFVANSCKDNKIIVYSDNIYKPIPPIETSSYKSPQDRPGQDKNNALAISISGGGSRAQYFGLGVLIGLDEIKSGEKTFLKEIDYFSTVSGGGYAAGYYLTLLKNDVLTNRTLFEFWISEDRKEVLQEFLFKGAHPISIVKLLAYERNLIRTSYPKLIDNELLQVGKKYNNKKIARPYLRDFFIAQTSSEPVKLPMFVTNGTIYNNGERLPYMPHIIKYLDIKGSLLPRETFTIDNGYGLPLTYAISGSAAFPGILPMSKFSLNSTYDEVIRVIDGGAVDNLGYKTLLELLSCDKVVKENKKALIVNCGGFGADVQQIANEHLGPGQLIKKSLLYTVDINLLNSNADILYLATAKEIKHDNIQKIGFYTIKDKYLELLKTASPTDITIIDNYKSQIKEEKIDWEDLYRELGKRNVFKDYNEKNFNNISDIPTARFENFGIVEIFQLFELAAQVNTKVKIYPWEKQALILAGRYAVWSKRSEIEKLIQ